METFAWVMFTVRLMSLSLQVLKGVYAVKRQHAVTPKNPTSVLGGCQYSVKSSPQNPTVLHALRNIT